LLPTCHRARVIVLASQLPDNASDANAVIRELQNLVDAWLHPAAITEPSKVFSLFRDRA
jgi:hypothetical protein